MSILLGNGGVRNVKEIYVGVDGAPRKVKEGYIGVGGVPKRFYSSFPPPGGALNDYTWAQIRLIADAGKAAEYFKVGDTKAVHLKGTASKLALDTTLYVFILGFDHDVEQDPGAKNTIDFGTFKDENGKDIALSSGYDDDSDFYMNPAPPTNIGGWRNSYMRNTILGSTKNENADAPEDTATNPKADTLMSCLPEDLRAVMKPMTVWSDNIGDGKYSDQNVLDTTVDYLPLPACREIIRRGKASFANYDEINHMTQYAYYDNGTDTDDWYNAEEIKYRHDQPGAPISWWLRSTHYYDVKSWCVLGEKGNPGSVEADLSIGVAPIFRV